MLCVIKNRLTLIWESNASTPVTLKHAIFPFQVKPRELILIVRQSAATSGQTGRVYDGEL